jgi:hypothetical protein
MAIFAILSKTDECQTDVFGCFAIKILTPALSYLFVYFFNIELTCPSEIHWFNIYWLIDDSLVTNVKVLILLFFSSITNGKLPFQLVLAKSNINEQMS